jgi:predicted nucleic acid-binding Zn ribbon protein
MFIVDARCKCCGFEPVEGLVFTSYQRYEEDINFCKCPKCKGQMERVFVRMPGIVFKEGMGEESSKPSSYWRNAERTKQNNIAKQVQIDQEKTFYKPK